MSIISVIPRPSSTHLVPSRNVTQHHLNDFWWCPCGPSYERTIDFGVKHYVIQHWDFAKRNVAKRVYEP